MARRPAPRRRQQAGGSPPMVFYGLIVLLTGLFLVAAFATLEEPQPPTPAAAAPPPAPTATPIIHVGQAGDNFIALGQRYGVPWQAIAAANGLPENAVLRLGQELIIPAPG